MHDADKLIYPPDHRPTRGTDVQRCQIVIFRMLRVIDAICRRYHIVYWLDGGTLLGAVRHQGFIPWDDDIDIVMPRADYQRFLSVAHSTLPDSMFVQTNESDRRYRRFGTPCKIRDRYSRVHQSGHDADEDHGMGFFIDIMPVDKIHAYGLFFKRDLAIKWVYKKLAVFARARRVPCKNVRSITGNTAILILPERTRVFMVQAYKKMLHRWIIPRNSTLKGGFLLCSAFDAYQCCLLNPKDVFPLSEKKFEGYSFPTPCNADAVLRSFYGDYMTLPPAGERTRTHFTVLEMDVRERASTMADNPNGSI